ncbi:tRNA guanosine(34) transglycosylase Tgt, partial [Candidatus Peregrinibacteria bacterium]|nr:tRNA guanosine(34) transglycosylase Tgt [Candidatus Peregrinibacteria bacterium]
MPFALLTTTPAGRRGQLTTPHGVIETPFFLPVATGGAMRGIRHEDLLALGAQALLCNTYHLHLRPGEDVVAAAGGLHSFIGWPKPILTDSGGFQVFSLRDRRSVTDDGVTFHSHLDGSRCFLGPREAMEIQHKLGADMIMCLDVCPPSTAKRAEIIAAVDRTLRWAGECKKWHTDDTLLFAIIQGGLERDLREKCAQELIAMGFDGYAIGGLAVGESETDMYEILDVVCPLLPVDKPRYLMGVGRLSQIPLCVA